MSSGFGGQISPPLNAPPAEPLTVGIAPGPSSLITTSNRVIIFGASGGQFVYNPSPSANALVASSTGQAVTDPWGNNALAGQTSYTNASTSPAAPPWTATNITGAGVNSFLSSVSGQNGTWTSQGAITFQAATSPKLVLPSGYTGAIPATQSDSTTFTVTTTAASPLSKSWTVNLGDATANTIYRLTAWGNGSQGTTPQNATISVFWSAVNLLAFGLSSGPWGASVAANFYVQFNVQVTASGASGNANVAGLFLLDNSATAAAIYAVPLMDLGNTINTTVANTLQIKWSWGGTTSAPTVSSYGSILERFSG